MKRKMYDRSLKLGISRGNGPHEGDKKAKILRIKMRLSGVQRHVALTEP